MEVLVTLAIVVLGQVTISVIHLIRMSTKRNSALAVVVYLGKDSLSEPLPFQTGCKFRA